MSTVINQVWPPCMDLLLASEAPPPEASPAAPRERRTTGRRGDAPGGAGSGPAGGAGTAPASPGPRGPARHPPSAWRSGTLPPLSMRQPPPLVRPASVPPAGRLRRALPPPRAPVVARPVRAAVPATRPLGYPVTVDPALLALARRRRDRERGRERRLLLLAVVAVVARIAGSVLLLLAAAVAGAIAMAALLVVWVARTAVLVWAARKDGPTLDVPWLGAGYRVRPARRPR
jgi:hypothetical protein